MTTSTTTSPEIIAFAAAVRTALDDLPRDEVDDLTDGLEADLTDRALDSGSAELGDPVAYAEELRSAAGLSARGARRSRGPVLDQAIANARENLRELRAHPRAQAALDFFGALTPVWWIARAWLVYLLVSALAGDPHLLPVNPLLLAVLVVAVIASVQVGRGRWMVRPALRSVVVLVNVVAVIAAPFVIGWTYAVQQAAEYSSYLQPEPYYPQGLTRDGVPITNVFAYGPDGEPLEGVQLFDQDGEPLDLVGDASTRYTYDNTGTILVPSDAVPGRTGWNVVPLERITESGIADDGTVSRSAARTAVKPPYSSIQPLAGFELLRPAPVG
jgi:hypothetical protein